MMQSDMSAANIFRNQGKIAIPRLERAPLSPPPPPKTTERRPEERIVRACEACRKRKTKCSGEASCSNCLSSGTECIHVQARRDRLKEALDKNQVLANLLRSISQRVGREDKKRIEEALGNVEDDATSQDTKTTRRYLGKRARVASPHDDEDEAEGGEAHVTASAGSNENLDHLGEDLLRTRASREIGYVGQNSEVQWLRSIQRQTEHTSTELGDQSGAYGPPGTERRDITARSDALHERRKNARVAGGPASLGCVADTTFYLDSDEIDFDIVVDAFVDPEADVAKRLFDCYIETVHPSFPLISEQFRAEFVLYHSNLTPSPVGKKGVYFPRKWRAQLNLLFAIGAKHSHLVSAEWAGDERDHVVYMTRAVYLLGLKDSIMLVSQPTLETVQGTATLALYFLAVGHVSRAWIVIGVTIRLAVALGLHLRNEDPKAELSKKEMLAQIWWTLNSIECLLSAITGRPPVIAYEDCTVSLPGEHQPTRGDGPAKRTDTRSGSKSDITAKPTRKTVDRRKSSSPDQYLTDHIKITIIMQEVLINLYAPRTAAKSWQLIESHMSKALEKLKVWRSSAIGNPTRSTKGKQKASHERQQFLLMTEYWSTKMLITRPCLCRIQQRIRNESTTSAEFNAASAEQCVGAAMEMAKLFPDEPDLNFIYTQGPWWSANHLIMQCIAVLLLDATFQQKDTGATNPSNVAALKKMMRWLRAMKYNDPVSNKAEKVVRKILRQVAPSLQNMANDLLSYGHDADTPWQDMSDLTSSTTQINVLSQLGPEPVHDAATNAATASTSAHMPLRHGEHVLPYDFVHAHAHDETQFPDLNPNLGQMAFGNPFFTPFDQDPPFANMAGLWTDSAAQFNSFDQQWPDLNVSLGLGEGVGADADLDQDMQYEVGN